MPKLNTTIDNLEWRSNKIISTNSTSPDTWTDAQYPSAKTLLNVAHPVGSILATGSNTNPSTYLGGTWTLVDKAFKGTFTYIDPATWAATSATLHETSNVLLIDHIINLRIYVKLTVAAAETDIVLGKVDLTPYGITSLSSAVYRQPAISESGNCTACYTLSTDGTITLNDVLNVDGTHAAAVGTDFIFNIVFPVGYDRMIDDFCDKFYWKRTA
jgi:hypothetical protein